MPDNEDLAPNLSSAVAQTGVADSSGGIAYSGVSDSSTAGEIAFQGPTADFILYGVVNGVFAQEPPDSASNLEPVNNPMWYWYGPVQVSGGAITCQWVTDSSSPSGQNLRFTLNPGAASDEAYVEQIVPIGGTRDRIAGFAVRSTFVNSGSTAFDVKTEAQFLTIAGATTGGAVSDTNSAVSAAATSVTYIEMGNPPTDAYYLRVRCGVVRGALAATSGGQMDLASVRLERQLGRVRIPEEGTPGSFAAATMFGFSGQLWIELPSDGEFNLRRSADGAWEQVSIDFDAAGGRSLWLGDGASTPDTRIYRAAAGVLATDKAIAYTGTITPTVSATQDNWAPTGIATCATILVDCDGASRTITGISASGFIEGQEFVIMATNLSGGTLTLSHASASSTAGNRFGMPGAVNASIAGTGDSVIIRYLPTYNSDNPFRVLSMN